MKSLRGFLRTKYLQRRLEQAPVVVDATVPGAEVTVSFSVHTWFEYHNRAHGSYTGETEKFHSSSLTDSCSVSIGSAPFFRLERWRCFPPPPTL